ncbi:hypothetical protein AGRA3207_007328 [Actinomadura graeca]|uniref:Uncharacterized protein n=1 Tax=Actinomadura graeca TaxID=2750812 RepID=A0ABX8R9X0_9ACTN|nr:hypothetical protein [Actinomadura graeca]QXJ25778.1 hypothetical protein AGRA3207_007328 [Actinomadura graeca]
MGTFFGELAKNLAERWVTLLALSGMLLVVVVIAGSRLGHWYALDCDGAQQHTSLIVIAISREDTGRKVLILMAALLAVAGCGLLVQVRAGTTSACGSALGPRSTRRCAARCRSAGEDAGITRSASGANSNAAIIQRAAVRLSQAVSVMASLVVLVLIVISFIDISGWDHYVGAHIFLTSVFPGRFRTAPGSLDILGLAVAYSWFGCCW